MAKLQERPGMSLDQVFNAVTLVEIEKEHFAVSSEDPDSVILSGLMKGATKKANGPDVVLALNLTFARGWAAAHGALRIVDGLKNLIEEVFELSETQADYSAKAICKNLKVDPNTAMNQNSDVIVPIALSYLENRESFITLIGFALENDIK